MILPLEIIIIIHYTIRLTYNTFNNHLLREGYALFIIIVVHPAGLHGHKIIFIMAKDF